MGCVLYALVVAVLTTVVLSSDANARAMSERLEAISSYIKVRRCTRGMPLPKSLVFFFTAPKTFAGGRGRSGSWRRLLELS